MLSWRSGKWYASARTASKFDFAFAISLFHYKTCHDSRLRPSPKERPAELLGQLRFFPLTRCLYNPRAELSRRRLHSVALQSKAILWKSRNERFPAIAFVRECQVGRCEGPRHEVRSKDGGGHCGLVHAAKHRRGRESGGHLINTLLNWMKQPEFDAAYREPRRAAFGQSISRLQQATGAAGSTLLKVMIDPNTPASTRVRAADSVLVRLQ